jgi:chromosomal replication initiation ATPase DnaA
VARQLVLQLAVQSPLGDMPPLETAGTEAARKALAAFAPSGKLHEGQTLLLVGPEGSGKSALMKAWLGRMEGNPQFTALAAGVDDIQDLDAEGQAKLFHHLNRNRESGGAMVLGSRVPVKELKMVADVTSRLLAGQQVFVSAPDDAELAALAQRWAAARQLVLPQAVVDYLLARAERSAVGLQALIAKLDALSLEEKRAVTVPLARRVLEGQQSAF